jgi:hypothetical protein
MNNDQTDQYSKFDSKGKAVTSLILGIISIIPGMIVYFAPGLQMVNFWRIIGIILWIILPFVALIGVILGIMALKSTKRNVAIAGIVLCGIGLIMPIIYIFFY